MSKTKVILLSLFVALVCKAKIIYGQHTTIVGKAGNAKYSAVVVTSTNNVYYLKSLKSWSPSFIDKTVKVTGKVVVKKLKKQKMIRGGITSPSIMIIKKPKFELIS